MICGSLMAVINGLIPSLGAMIYGNLTDELVIRKTQNCTLNENVTRITLENLVIYEMLQPRMKLTNVMMTRFINITVNNTGIRAEIIGMNGNKLREGFFANISNIWLKGTALKGTELVGVDLRGTTVTKTPLKVKGVYKERGNDGDNNNDSDENISVRLINNQPIDKDDRYNTTNGTLVDPRSGGVIRSSQERSVSQSQVALDSSLFESLRKKRDNAFLSGLGSSLDPGHFQDVDDSNLVPQSLILGSSQNSARIVSDFADTEKPDVRKSTIQGNRKTETNKTQLGKMKDYLNVSDEFKVGKAQSITKLFPPTPRPIILPPTNNVTYILRNITESCRWYENNVEENMRKYALYYVFAAFGTLVFAYGQTVFWNIASERGVRNLSDNLTDAVLDKDPGFYDTKIYEGVPNLESIT